MSRVQLAVKRGRLVGDQVVKWWSDSKFSHCELIVDGVGMSATMLKGVRSWVPEFDGDTWAVVDLPWANADRVLDLFHRTDRARYDWLGLIGSQLFNRRTHDKALWFCSEWCAEGLGLPNPQTYNPTTLMELCVWINLQWGLAYDATRYH